MEDKKITKKTGSYQALPNPSKSVREIKSRISKSSHIKDLKKLNQPIVYVFLVLLVSFGSGYAGATLEQNRVLTTSQVREIVSTKDQLDSAIYNAVSPSVVSINAISTTDTTNIFGLTQPTQEESQGTGIIISSSGYIITNRHVIPTGVTSVSITLNDGTVINNVTVVGTTNQSDPLDVAVLKINNPPINLQPALLGDSSTVSIGDSVVAIGNALGQFENTVTSGIISGRGRSLQAGSDATTNSEDLQDMLQTDAAINEGNSGGPLINSSGEVIGMNTAVASNGAQNIGFAIPINDVKGIIKGVISSGKVERPYIGVYYESINSSIAKQYSLSINTGAYIPTTAQNQGQNPIVSGSPADQAGLTSGDIIVSVNGVVVNQNNSLSSLIDQNPVGAQLSLQIIRNGAPKTISLTIGNEFTSTN
jgi:serine protease Do